MNEIFNPEQLGRCQDCPRIRSILVVVESEREASIQWQNDMLSRGVDDIAEDIIGVFGEMFRSFTDYHDGSSLATGLRQEVAKRADECDKVLTEMEEGLLGIARDCSGPVTLEAIRSDIEYRATLCGNPDLVDLPQSHDWGETAVVIRRRA